MHLYVYTPILWIMYVENCFCDDNIYMILFSLQGFLFYFVIHLFFYIFLGFFDV